MSKTVSICTHSKNSPIRINTDRDIIKLTMPKDTIIYGDFGEKFYNEEKEYIFNILATAQNYVICFNELTDLFYINQASKMESLDINIAGYFSTDNDGKISNIYFVNNNNPIVVNNKYMNITDNIFTIINNRNNIIVNFEEGTVSIPPLVILYNNEATTMVETSILKFDNTTTAFLYFNPDTYLFEILDKTDIDKIYVCTINSYKELVTGNRVNGVVDCINRVGLSISSTVVGFCGDICVDEKRYYYDKFYTYSGTTSRTINAGYVDLPTMTGIYLIILNVKSGNVAIIKNESFDPDYFIILDTIKSEGDYYNIYDYYSMRDTRYNSKDKLEDRVSELEVINELYKPLAEFEILSPTTLYIDESSNLYPDALVTNNNITMALKKDSDIIYPTHTINSSELNDSKYDLLVYDKVSNTKKSKTIRIKKTNNASANKNCIIIGELPVSELHCNIVHHFNTNTTAEKLVGMNTTDGLSPFMRIATKFEKEVFGEYCFTYTGRAVETSYKDAEDKTKDFYIFDALFYCIKNNINDDINFFILNLDIIDATYKNTTAYEIITTLIRQKYQSSYVGVIPLVHIGYPRFSNVEYYDFMKNIGTKALTLIESIDKDSYDAISIIPTWCYIDPIFGVTDMSIELNDIGKRQLENSINLWVDNQ